MIALIRGLELQTVYSKAQHSIDSLDRPEFNKVTYSSGKFSLEPSFDTVGS